jgi:hypothetical protein
MLWPLRYIHSSIILLALLMLNGEKTTNAFNLPTYFRSSEKNLMRHQVRMRSMEPKTAIESVIQRQDLLQIRKGDDEEVSDPSHLLTIDEDGSLRINEGPVLLDGLEPTMWTGITPETTIEEDSQSHSSLFLHAAQSKKSAHHELSLGHLVTCNRLLACSRLTRYWMGPAFGTKANDLPLDTQFLLLEVSKDGPYAIILPLVDAGFRASLEYSGDEKISVICYSESGDAAVSSDGMMAIYVAVSDDPFELIKRGFQEVSDKTGTFRTLHQKELPSSVDDFGW